MKNIVIEFNENEFNAIVGIVDLGIKQIGIRAMEEDIISLVNKLKLAANENEKDKSDDKK